MLSFIIRYFGIFTGLMLGVAAFVVGSRLIMPRAGQTEFIGFGVWGVAVLGGGLLMTLGYFLRYRFKTASLQNSEWRYADSYEDHVSGLSLTEAQVVSKLAEYKWLSVRSQNPLTVVVEDSAPKIEDSSIPTIKDENFEFVFNISISNGDIAVKASKPLKIKFVPIDFNHKLHQKYYTDLIMKALK